MKRSKKGHKFFGLLIGSIIVMVCIFNASFPRWLFVFWSGLFGVYWIFDNSYDLGKGKR
jgi:hypothetical protein